jgi:hypothetical protein
MTDVSMIQEVEVAAMRFDCFAVRRFREASGQRAIAAGKIVLD